MPPCDYCSCALDDRRHVCDECAAEVRRAKERRRQLAPFGYEPSRIRLPLGAAPEERFWAKVHLADECWTWTGSRNGRGYGQFNLDGMTRKVHRVAYEWLVGPIPEGLQLDHLCGNKACVRPEHLEPVTNEENSRRARERQAA